MKCKVCGKECGKYKVCYTHRNTKYKDICKIHGKTIFINNQCQKCKQLKEVIYIIRDKKDRFGNKITRSHFLYPHLKRLTHLTRSYQKKFMQRISKTSGIYGIFYKSTCLYVGQSVNISMRVHQHKEQFKKAQNHIKGIKIHKKRVHINKIKRKTDYKYYEMAKNYRLSDLSFKTLYAVPHLDNEFEFNELLTYCEQAMMIAYNPKYNTIAARPTKSKNL